MWFDAMWRSRADEGERGAALVEFALVLPLLLVLVFGIIEASWAFGQQNDIRHGAREGARLAAVDHGDVTVIALEVCDRMDVVYPASNPIITLTPTSVESTRGGLATINVRTNFDSLTGFLDEIFGSLQLESSVEFRLELPTSGEPAWWASGSGGTFTCP
jgi:Flp pilus assembly protein TadG